MARKYDESDAKVRPARSTRPRSKDRPSHKDAIRGFVIQVDRGRTSCVTEAGVLVSAMKARELGKNSVVVGDQVALVGDTSGSEGSLSRIVSVYERKNSLTRTVDDAGALERMIVANVDQMVIVIAAANPEPRSGLVDRCLVVAFDQGIEPIILITKSDLADANNFLKPYLNLGVKTLQTRRGGDLIQIKELLRNKTSVLIGHSGVGKSTLVNDILYTTLANKLNGARLVPGRHRTVTGIELLDKVVHVDQSPIGRTPRSNPATYTGVFDKIRALFAETSEAKIRGYQQGRFSFNVKGGRCENCSGDGTITIEMNFLPDVYVPCEVCHGARYNRETLEVHYKSKTIAEVLNMPIEEAHGFFESVPAIARYLKTLNDVGLGYVRLGQSAPTLSGGEAQRVKLATELQRRSTGRTIYVLDEPTTGLHFEDVNKLLTVLNRLVDTGNTVVVIEHNLDVIKCSDWVIDMGPEGGFRGGLVVAEGTPETVAAVKESYTGQFLGEILKSNRKAPAKK